MRVNDSEQELSAKKRRAIEALLADPTITRAAKAAGISEATIHRWMAEPIFAAALDKARRAIFDDAMARLRATTGEAVEALRRNLNCGNPADEIRAGRAILELHLRISEREELERRIEVLEELARVHPSSRRAA